ncbi:MAG: helix-turn-helix domain-containing protein [Anaerolineae bacterium]|nr:helix-turn-helix domain-containing protein [Anaerolineae bacterium]
MIDGKRLRELREAYGFSRREFAEKVDIAESQIVRYEIGKNDATGDVLARMATFFGVSTDYLLGLTDNPASPIGTDLTQAEAAAIAAWRRGDFREVMKVIGSEAKG